MNGLTRRYYEGRLDRTENRIELLRNYLDDCSALSCHSPEEENAGVCDEIRSLEQQRNKLRNKLSLEPATS